MLLHAEMRVFVVHFAIIDGRLGIVGSVQAAQAALGKKVALVLCRHEGIELLLEVRERTHEVVRRDRFREREQRRGHGAHHAHQWQVGNESLRAGGGGRRKGERGGREEQEAALRARLEEEQEAFRLAQEAVEAERLAAEEAERARLNEEAEGEEEER